MPETLTTVRERPFIARPWEVRAMLDGRMTQFRRPIKPQPEACDHTDWPEYPRPDWQCDSAGWYCAVCGNGVRLTRDDVAHIRCPFGAPGDVLYVCEAWRTWAAPLVREDGELEDLGIGIEFLADDAMTCLLSTEHIPHRQLLRLATQYQHDMEHVGRPRTRPSVYLPRWASRLTLEIVDVKVERVCEISEEDAMASGVVVPEGSMYADLTPNAPWYPHTHRTIYAGVWENNFPNHPWESSWCWAVTFKLVQPC